MDRPVQGTNFQTDHSYYTYFIEFFLKVQAIDPRIFKELYEEKGLSISQIATKLDVSKDCIRKHLKKNKVNTKRSVTKLKNPNNYRFPRPPYGYKRGKNSELIINKYELKVCRLAVYLKSQGLSLRVVGLELQKRGFKNRQGRISWHPPVIQRMITQWKDKI